MSGLPPLAEVADLEVRLRRALTGEETAAAAAALADASSLVRAEGRQDWWTEAGGLTVPDAVVTVVLTAAKRAFDNPDGVVSETVGPFTRRRSDDSASGAYLTEEEKAIVRRYRATSPGLWTQRTTREDPNNEGSTTVFLEDSYGCELFPAASTEDGVW